MRTEDRRTGDILRKLPVLWRRRPDFRFGQWHEFPTRERNTAKMAVPRRLAPLRQHGRNRLPVDGPNDALLADDGRDKTGRRHVEGRVVDGDRSVTSIFPSPSFSLSLKSSTTYCPLL